MTKKSALGVFLVLAAMMTPLLGVSSVQAQVHVRRVDASAPAGNGLSWTTPYNDLQAALDAAAAPMSGITEIRVAKGTYKPSVPVTPNLRNKTFTMINGVAILGGYAGVNASNPDERMPSVHETILSGDQGVTDGPWVPTDPVPASWNDNSYHVVTASNRDSTAILDGFVIEHGYANGSSTDSLGGGIVNDRLSTFTALGATIRNCLIRSNFATSGAGMMNSNNASSTLINCVFEGNRASSEGGGFYCSSVQNTSLVRNCTFRKNRANANGGGLFASRGVDAANCVFSGNSAFTGGGLYAYDVASTFIMTNCTFSANSATVGSAISNQSGSPQYNNCIIWGNPPPLSPVVDNFAATPIFRFSNIQGSGGSGAWLFTLLSNGGGNKDANPLFVDADGADSSFGTSDDDLRLLSTSPSVDAGNNSLIPVGVTTDRNGNCRIINGVVDMGAYELTQADNDGDGIDNNCDNCVTTPNPTQANVDGDSLGDACDGCPNDPNKIAPGVCGCGIADIDTDGDGTPDCVDNCPSAANPGQANSDGDTLGNACDNCDFVTNPSQMDSDSDTIGDACDNCDGTPNTDQLDTDTDSVGDACDNCPSTANASQTDGDGDGFGDACDNCPSAANADQADVDTDGRGDVCDNCPNHSNSGQENADNDALGDVCDACPNDPSNDSDSDGVCGDSDNCPTPNPLQTNSDGDALGDDCDNCVSMTNPLQEDDDTDNVGNACDNCASVWNNDQIDTDADSLGDACDPDDDGDGMLDSSDNCPIVSNPEQLDTDGDLVGDACDGDDDGDGTPDATDNCPLVGNGDQADADFDNFGDACDNCDNAINNDQADTDSDSVGDACDNCPASVNTNQTDADGDGKGDACDNCPAVSNASQTDYDNDGLGDACDPCPLDENDDVDGDGVCGNIDNCPTIANPGQEDLDGDTLGDPCDPCPTDALNDVDGDGICGNTDNCPTTANSDQANFDGDAEGDACDADDDNDGLTDAQEASLDNGDGCPSPFNDDSDGDGLTDAYEVGIEFSPCNARPTANACVQQLTTIGAMAQVRLDGTGSSDADDNFSTLTFKWTVNYTIVCNSASTSCATTTVSLPYGVHNVTLRVTDPVGGWHETTTEIILSPAHLSVFEIDTANIRFNGGSTKVAKLSGEIGLPFGVNYSELNSIGTAQIVLAGITIAPTATLDFVTQGSQGKKWRYDSSTGPITRFDIDWAGARFKYSKHNFPIEFESQLISTSETVLTMRFDRKKLGGAVTVNFNNQGTVSIATNGTVTSYTLPIEIEKPGKEVTLTLPFPLTDTSIITISGGQSRTIEVEDYLTASVGRFRIETNFNGADFPNGVNTLPRMISASVTIGTEAYPGSDSVAASALSKEGQHWTKSSCD